MKTHDRDVRTSLVAWLKQRPGAGRILHEVWMPLSHHRADVVEVNGTLSAFEIKSGSDDLSRLPSQLASFGKLFDHLSIVCDVRHTNQVLDLAPNWCGILEAEESGASFHEVRSASLNPDLDSGLQLRLLWRDELLRAASSLGVDSRARTRAELRHELLTRLSAHEISSLVREALSARNLELRRF